MECGRPRTSRASAPPLSKAAEVPKWASSGKLDLRSIPGEALIQMLNEALEKTGESSWLLLKEKRKGARGLLSSVKGMMQKAPDKTNFSTTVLQRRMTVYKDPNFAAAAAAAAFKEEEEEEEEEEVGA